MVASHLMTETHSFVAPLVDAIKVTGLAERGRAGRRLRLHRARDEQKDQADERRNFHAVA